MEHCYVPVKRKHARAYGEAVENEANSVEDEGKQKAKGGKSAKKGCYESQPKGSRTRANFFLFLHAVSGVDWIRRKPQTEIVSQAQLTLGLFSWRKFI
jgi:hypothetical protein